MRGDHTVREYPTMKFTITLECSSRTTECMSTSTLAEWLGDILDEEDLGIRPIRITVRDDSPDEEVSA